MPPSSDSNEPSRAALERARLRRTRAVEIQAGSLPSLEELLDGAAFSEGRLARDCSMWARSILAEPDLPTDVRAAFEVLASTVTTAALHIARGAIEAGMAAGEWLPGDLMLDATRRLDVYSSMLPGYHRRDALITALLDPSGSYHRRLAIALGIRNRSQGFGRQLTDMESMFVQGSQVLAELTQQLVRSEAADRAIADAKLGSQHDDAIADVLEDRSEFREPTGLAALAIRAHEARFDPRFHLMVVPPRPDSAGSRHDAWKSFAGVAGALLPLRRRGDVTAHMIALRLRAPHAAEAIATVLRDLASSEVAWIRPTLLVGPPGAGKTSLARSIADTIGLPSTIYSAGGLADSSMMGTSAQWSTARPSVPLDLIRSSKIANPLVVLDEIDKTDLDRRNGSLADALLGFLEPTTSRRYRDLALEVEVDLSRVSWIATANKLSDVPAPLRDRMRVIQVDEPTWAHVGDLARNIVGDIAVERGIDRRWIEDLAADELDVVREAWPGGSIRKLRRALEVMIDGRDSLMGRA